LFSLLNGIHHQRTKATPQSGGEIDLRGITHDGLPHLRNATGIVLLLGNEQQAKPYRRQMDRGDIASIVACLALAIMARAISGLVWLTAAR